MVFKLLEHVLGNFPETDRQHLKRIEKDNNCRFTVVNPSDFVKDLDFFKENKDHLLLIQSGLCVPFANIHPEKPFYGVIRDAYGFKELTGEDMSFFYCPGDEVRLVPMWVYKPNC